MRKFQCLLLMLKRSYICYYIIFMTVTLKGVSFYCFKLLRRRIITYVAMEIVIEISSGEEDDLLIIKLKKVKLERLFSISI